MATLQGLRSTLWIVSGMLCVSSTVFAETLSPVVLAQAQQHYEEAIALMDAQSYATACPKLEKVTKLVPNGIGGHEALAECYENLGRIGSAWEQYTVAQTLSLKAGEPERAATLSAHAKTLEPKVAKITIVIDQNLRNVGGLTILHDGEVQEPALWNTPLPVDTGKHTIEAKAAGRESWSKEVMVLADGASIEVEVPITRLNLLQVEPYIPGGGGGAHAVVSSPRTWQRPLGFATLGLGVAGLATSGILSGLALEKRDASNADGHCNGSNVCDAVGLPLRDQAMGLANGATATIVAGGVLAAGGLVMVLTAPKKKEEDAKKTAETWGVQISPMGVGLRGTW